LDSVVGTPGLLHPRLFSLSAGLRRSSTTIATSPRDCFDLDRTFIASSITISSITTTKFAGSRCSQWHHSSGQHIIPPTTSATIVTLSNTIKSNTIKSNTIKSNIIKSNACYPIKTHRAR
jgi:hypothetical protein